MKISLLFLFCALLFLSCHLKEDRASEEREIQKEKDSLYSTPKLKLEYRDPKIKRINEGYQAEFTVTVTLTNQTKSIIDSSHYVSHLNIKFNAHELQQHPGPKQLDTIGIVLQIQEQTNKTHLWLPGATRTLHLTSKPLDLSIFKYNPDNVWLEFDTYFSGTFDGKPCSHVHDSPYDYSIRQYWYDFQDSLMTASRIHTVAH